jgi:uncharacterized protein (DUF1330 family)
MTAYWVNTFRSISDLDALGRYAALATDVMAARGGVFIARGVPAAAYEAGVLERTTIIAFESVEAAIATYESPEYQAALAELGDGAVRDIRIVDGA